ncbi:Smr/MutS family protein [Mesorhizobium sp. KR9-304]|uniref:Smr/MutS family protein n=1 Tax=Mesorhizobium sp. KR9-304 TaxID=3156614 RepID=UPI0032B45112
MSRAGKKLTDEDRVLWSLVAKSARPLKGRKPVEEETPKPAALEKQPAAAAAAATAQAPVPPKRQHVAHVLDRPTLDKLARGRLPIEGRVDLHGMTQSEAHSLLLSFLQRAHAGGVRYVLVITGKGFSSGGDGILRRQVPAWLSTPPFRALVSSHDLAARNHGGEGALYVRLRRKA